MKNDFAVHRSGSIYLYFSFALRIQFDKYYNFRNTMINIRMYFEQGADAKVGEQQAYAYDDSHSRPTDCNLILIL